MTQTSARRGYFPGWTVVGGSAVGVAFGSATFISSSFALLASAIGAQYGWAQADLAKAASVVLLLQMVMYPALGFALDRFGSRKVASVSILLFALALVAISRVGHSLTELYLAFGLVGLLATGTNVVSYARALTLWFDRRRGLALGLAASGQAVGAFLLPIVLQRLIASSGWPTALLALAGFEALVCFPLVALLVRDDPKPFGLQPDGAAADRAAVAAPALGDAAPVVVAKPELGPIVRTATFWKLCVGFGVMGLSFYAWTTNITFILTQTAGMSMAQIAGVQAASGVAYLVGRIAFGYLLDKFHAPRLAVVALVLAALFYLLMASTGSHAVVLVAILLGGVSAGGEADLLPYLASRYFGEQAVSTVFGWFLCAYVVGAAMGPVSFAYLMAMFKGPTAPLYMLTALQIVPALLFVSLGPYRFKPRQH